MNRLSWFATDNGRKFVFGSTAVGTFTTVSLMYFPNTLFINKYQEIVQSYSDGLPRSTSDRVLKCFDKAVQMLSISEQTKKLIRPFTVVGCDLFNAGTTYSKYGAIIGIPVNYAYINEDSVDKREILVRQEPVDWETEEGRKLARSLVLTEDEKVFGIAREILTANTAKKALIMMYPPLAIMFCYTLSSYLNKRLNLFQRAVQLRGIMYGIVTAYTFGLYCLARDFTETFYEQVVDEQLADMGPRVSETGVSFYDKLLQRNTALRAFIGEHAFTAYGNEHFLIRQKRLPLTVRKEYFEKRCEEYKQNKMMDA